MKRLIASPRGHMGFVMLGISTLTEVGINAAVIGMVATASSPACSSSWPLHPAPLPHPGDGPPRRNQKTLPILGGILGFAVMASLACPAWPASG